jgi:hypothetical protein
MRVVKRFFGEMVEIGLGRVWLRFSRACFCFLLDRHLKIEAEFHTTSPSVAGFRRNDRPLAVSILGWKI